MPVNLQRGCRCRRINHSCIWLNKTVDPKFHFLLKVAVFSSGTFDLSQATVKTVFGKKTLATYWQHLFYTHTPGRSASSINLFADDSLLFSLIKIWVTVIASLWDNCDCLTVKLLIRLSHEVKVETNDHNYQNRAMKSSNVPFTWNLPMQGVMLISKINM